MPVIHLLLADDHRIFLQSLAASLTQYPDLCITAQARNGLEALQQLEFRSCQVAVLDADMPVLNGLSAARLIRQQYPAVRVLIMSGSFDRFPALKFIEAGVAGCLSKTVAVAELYEAIRAVAAGEQYISSEVAQEMSRQYEALRQPAVRPLPETEPLTGRETQILSMVVQEYTSSEIASQLSISPLTVETHRKKLMQKLGVHNIVGLVKHALRTGLVKLD